LRVPRKGLVLVALGGNALLRKGERGTFEEQYGNIRRVAEHFTALIEAGYDLVITHGNGPQVGASILRHEAGERAHEIPALPMHVCTAETQGFIGFMIQQALENELAVRGLRRCVVTLVTRTRVDAGAPAFRSPEKPIGPHYTAEEVERIRRERPDWTLVEDCGRGYRRVVPSPDPMSVLEADAILSLVERRFIVVAAGGGGIPVADETGAMRGVDAVVDKDLASERLATYIGAERFVILTDVDAAYLNYGRPDQRKLGYVGVSEMRRYYAEGHFKAGSMGPKVLAAIRFVENGGREAIIAKLDRLMEAIAGEDGTHVVPDAEVGIT